MAAAIDCSRSLPGPAIAEVVGAVGAAVERVLADRMLVRRVNP
jgi:hypothetical protein